MCIRDRYIPKHTAVADKSEIFDIIESNSFAILITNSQTNLKATHLPMLLDRNEGELGTLIGHIAAANDQLRLSLIHISEPTRPY